MGKRRKKGTPKGMEAQGRYSPPERNRLGTYGSHRTAEMDLARERRLANRHNLPRTTQAPTPAPGLLEYYRPTCTICDGDDHTADQCPHGDGTEASPCDRGTPGCAIKRHSNNDEECETY